MMKGISSANRKMTIDDDCSIYVGGLPYDATEESLQKIFEIYGAVVAVKIINDRTIGGKCYGFVTFTNPRSAMHAIREMNGSTIDGRVVKVNEVKSRGGRSSFGREGFHRTSERGIGSDRDRGREKDHDHHGRDLDRDNYRERSREFDQEREKRYDQLYDNDRRRDSPVSRDAVRNQLDRDNYRERSREREQERVRRYDQLYDNDRRRDSPSNRDAVHDQKREMEYFARQRERIHDYEGERDREVDREIQRTPDHRDSRERDSDQVTKELDRSYSNDRGKRDQSLESSDDDEGKVQLQISNQKLHELQKEISQMEKLAEEKDQIVLKLQEKSQKLEDSLTDAKRFTSFRQMQLSKLHECYLRVRDCNEKLKSCEQELQSLVNSTELEVGYGDGVGTGTVS